MPKLRQVLALSPQQVDPLSWFIGSHAATVFTAFIVVYGLLQTALTWGPGGGGPIQLLAVGICAGATLIVQLAIRPMGPKIGWRMSITVLSVAVLGVTVSAVGYAGSQFYLPLWWAPIGLAFAIGSLCPHLAVGRLLILGTAATGVSALVALAILYPVFEGPSRPLGALTLIGYAPMLATVAAGIFGYTVVHTMQPMIERPESAPAIGPQARAEVTDQLGRATVARLTARAAPFLTRIADAGRITTADRALAGQLARRMREELVTQSNLSWLDLIASRSRLLVVDPDRRARGMNHAQRTALRAMIRAILDTPGTDAGSLMVELRAAPDGATAVGVSLDIALPEGRKIMHLAPYYLTLGTAVEDLKLESQAHLRMSFRVPADD